jgi:hypothetical protein
LDIELRFIKSLSHPIKICFDHLLLIGSSGVLLSVEILLKLFIIFSGEIGDDRREDAFSIDKNGLRLIISTLEKDLFIDNIWEARTEFQNELLLLLTCYLAFQRTYFH